MKGIWIYIFMTYSVGIFSGCSYDLSFEGKSCDATHPCPSGYTCTSSGTCSDSAGDAGVKCTLGEARCSEDRSSKEICEEGQWHSDDCTPGYCENGECVANQSCVQSSDCPDGQWCGPDFKCIPKGNCEDPGIERCDSQLKSIEVCDPESGNMVLVANCEPDIQYCDPFLVQCLSYCSNDLDCQSIEDGSCEPVSRKCMGMELCDSNQACAGLQCVGEPGACVIPPSQTGQLAGGGEMDLDCYIGSPPVAPEQPPSCSMQGVIVNFLNGSPCEDEALGLDLKVFPLSEILSGNKDSALFSTTVEQVDADGRAIYRFDELPTNEPLVLQVGSSGSEGDFADLFTFSVYIRADECSAGSVDFAAPALYRVNYDGYANPFSIVANPDKGLLFGQLRDCNAHRLLYGTGGISMPHELLYYLRGYIPDDSLTSTGTTGFFIAVNVTPIQGIASALVKSVDGPDISLWERHVRVFPGSASLVLFEKPKGPR